MSIDAEIINKVMMDSLFKDDEITDGKPPSDAVIVNGIMNNFGFHPQRLESHRQEIIDAIRELPDEFVTGGGWSFLNLCNDRHGHQWGEHPNMEQLCCLAIGLGLAKWCLPRDMWGILPGSMPYVSFNTNPKKVAVVS